MNRRDPSLGEYARELRWAQQCRRWALPIAGSLCAATTALLLWALWSLSDALL